MAGRKPRRPRKPRAKRRSPKTTTSGGVTYTTYDGGIRGFTTDVESLPEYVIDQVAYDVDRIARKEADRAKMPFRDRGNGAGAKIVKRGGGEGRAYVTMIGTPAGPWVWVEDGVKRHRVGERRTRRRKQGSRRRLAITPGSGYAMYAHASFPKRRAWTKTLDKSREVFDDAMTDVFRRVIG